VCFLWFLSLHKQRKELACRGETRRGLTPWTKIPDETIVDGVDSRVRGNDEGEIPLQRTPHFFGRIASGTPWMKAFSFGMSSGFSLPVKSGMPRSLAAPPNT
jgi:hypothetical protein